MHRLSKLQLILFISGLVLLPSSLFAAVVTSWPEERIPILGSADVTVRAVSINNWLADNIQSMPADQIQPAKENIYLIIDSIVKQNRLESKTDFSESDDFFLRSMFNWASYLGVPGSDLVSDHFNGKASPVSPKRVTLPQPFSITFKYPLIRLSSSDGDWTLIYPYWFMTGYVQSFQAHNNLETEIAEVSTAFAKHVGIEGYSQATIMFIFSPGNNDNIFKNFWMQSVGLKDADKIKETLRAGSATYVTYDTDKHMYKEVTFLRGTKGDIAVVYVGINGTYQANRESYLEFLKDIKL